jgi:hypothetical protein
MLLSPEQENAVKLIQEKKNVFISGNAGTGKIDEFWVEDNSLYWQI